MISFSFPFQPEIAILLDKLLMSFTVTSQLSCDLTHQSPLLNNSHQMPRPLTSHLWEFVTQPLWTCQLWLWHRLLSWLMSTFPGISRNSPAPGKTQGHTLQLSVKWVLLLRYMVTKVKPSRRKLDGVAFLMQLHHYAKYTRFGSTTVHRCNV
jgi:hypothetical protein